MLRNFSEKLREKFPSTTLGYYVVRITHLDGVFLGIFELEASLVEGQSLRQKREEYHEKGRSLCCPSTKFLFLHIA